MNLGINSLLLASNISSAGSTLNLKLYRRPPPTPCLTSVELQQPFFSIWYCFVQESIAFGCPTWLKTLEYNDITSKSEALHDVTFFYQEMYFKNSFAVVSLSQRLLWQRNYYPSLFQAFRKLWRCAKNGNRGEAQRIFSHVTAAF